MQRRLTHLIMLLFIFTLGSCHKKSSSNRASSLTPSPAKSDSHEIAFPGFVKATDEELIYPVSGLGWVFKITMIVDEGTIVKPGQQVVQFENEEDAKIKADAGRELDTAKLEVSSTINAVEQEVADLVKAVDDMKRQLEIQQLSNAENQKSQVALWTTSAREVTLARMEEKILRTKISLTESKLARKRRLLTATRESGEKRLNLLTVKNQKMEELMKAGTRRATREGIVVYKRSPWEQKKPRLGSSVYVGSPVIGIYNMNSLYVDGYVPEKQYQSVSVGRAVIIKTLGGREAALTGAIEQVSGTVMPIKDWELAIPIPEKIAAQRTFKVKIKLDQQSGNLSPDDEVRVIFAHPAEGK